MIERVPIYLNIAFYFDINTANEPDPVIIAYFEEGGLKS